MFDILVGFIVGLVLGSFAGMASWRWPLGLSWLGRSGCAGCRKPLRPLELIPIFSWVLQRGRCGCGDLSLSRRYPAIELVAALLVAVGAWQFGLGLAFVLFCGLVTLLLIIAVIDLEHGYIPDGAQIFLLLLAAGWAFTHGHSLIDIGLSIAMLGGLGFFLAGPYSWLRKRDMLGWGDVKFLACAAPFLLPAQIPPFLFMAGLFGVGQALAARSFGEKEFPFAPSLAAALVLSLLPLVRKALDVTLAMAYNPFLP